MAPGSVSSGPHALPILQMVIFLLFRGAAARAALAGMAACHLVVVAGGLV